MWKHSWRDKSWSMDAYISPIWYNRYKQLLEAWKKSKPTPQTPTAAASLVIQTLRRYNQEEVEVTCMILPKIYICYSRLNVHKQPLVPLFVPVKSRSLTIWHADTFFRNCWITMIFLFLHPTSPVRNMLIPLVHHRHQCPCPKGSSLCYSHFLWENIDLALGMLEKHSDTM